MSYQGQVQNGVIVYRGEPPLPEGTEVRIEPISETPLPTPPEPTPEDIKALWDGLMSFAGRAKGLPSDLAERHDHYRRERQKR